MSTANGRPAAQQGGETVVSDEDEFDKAFAELNAEKPTPSGDGDTDDDNDAEPFDQDDTGDDPDDSGGDKPGGDADDVGDEPGSEQDGDEDQGTDGGGKPDIWASADPALKAAFEAEKAAREKAEQSARSNAGRITAYQRQISELQNSGQQAAARSKQQGQAAADPKAAAQDAAAVNELKQDDQWRQFKEDYPDVAGPVENIISQMGQQVATQQSELAALNQERRNRHYVEQETALTETHPDWKQVITSHEFIDWFNAAPPSIRDMVVHNADAIADAQTAGAALTLFKAQTGAFSAANPDPEPPASDAGSQKQISDRRKRQLEAGTTGSARRSGGTNAGGPPDDFDAAFAYHARQAEKQRN